MREASAGAFNFNLTMTLISLAIWVSVIFTLGIGFLWAVPLWIGLFVVQVVVHVKGVMVTNEGRTYHYPAQLRVLA